MDKKEKEKLKKGNHILSSANGYGMMVSIFVAPTGKKYSTTRHVRFKSSNIVVDKFGNEISL